MTITFNIVQLYIDNFSMWVCDWLSLCHELHFQDGTRHKPAKIIKHVNLCLSGATKILLLGPKGEFK